MGIKIIAYDDNEQLLDSMKLWLNEADDMEFLSSYSNCNNVIRDIQRMKPDVVIMDIDMPGMNGIEGVKLIRKNFPSVQILMQTVFDDDEKIFAAIRAGAAGYILKNAEPDHLLESIRQVYNGGAPMTPSIARKVLNQFKQISHDANTDYNLSPREAEVLSLLVNGKSYKMICDELNISYETVRSHMKKIYEKLHVSSMTEAVAKAINQKLFSIL